MRWKAYWLRLQSETEVNGTMSIWMCRKIKSNSRSLWLWKKGRRIEDILWMKKKLFWQKKSRRNWKYRQETWLRSVMKRKEISRSRSKLSAKIIWDITCTWRQMRMRLFITKNRSTMPFSIRRFQERQKKRKVSAKIFFSFRERWVWAIRLIWNNR